MMLMPTDRDNQQAGDGKTVVRGPNPFTDVFCLVSASAGAEEQLPLGAAVSSERGSQSSLRDSCLCLVSWPC